jgi:succinate-semialdehyde dehydrogenase/glutarate-semialdehyde dehydrogenase
MNEVAKVLKSRREKLARLMTAEMGKINQEAISEIEKYIWTCEYYAEKAARMLADEEVVTDMARSFVTYQPIGVVLAVMPWNFPSFRFFISFFLLKTHSIMFE